MKLRVQNVMDATLVLTAIINEQRAMPQKGKYRVARMHAKMLPEFKIIDARRDEMIKAYNMPQTRLDKTLDDPMEHEVPIDGQWQVPADKMPEFIAAWKVIGDEEIDVDVQPIPISSLSLSEDADGSIQSHELAILGNLITE